MMSNFVTRDALSITCTCTHGGGGHLPACAMFTATAEQYREVCAERDKLRAVAKAARAWGDGEPMADDALVDAIEAVKVHDQFTGKRVWPWWMRTP